MLFSQRLLLLTLTLVMAGCTPPSVRQRVDFLVHVQLGLPTASITQPGLD